MTGVRKLIRGVNLLLKIFKCVIGGVFVCLFVLFHPLLSPGFCCQWKKNWGQLKETESVFAMPMRVPKGNC